MAANGVSGQERHTAASRTQHAKCPDLPEPRLKASMRDQEMAGCCLPQEAALATTLAVMPQQQQQQQQP
jgi:hypothetical protein